MKLKLSSWMVLPLLLLNGAEAKAAPHMLAYCESNLKQYICCPEKGGWIVGSYCSHGQLACGENDKIVGSDKTLAQDCNGKVSYPWS